MNQRPIFINLFRAFWQGVTQPHAGTALAALLITLVTGVLLLSNSTESKVRRTDSARWLRTADDDYGHLTAITLQGAERHARGPGANLVFVGPSVLQNLLPSPAELDRLLTAAYGRSAHGLDLTARALSVMDAAAVIDRFGANFEGWFIVGFNRHTLARNLRQELDRKDKLGFLLPFDSPLLNDDLARAGLPPAVFWNIAAFDHAAFYFGSLSGWKYLLHAPPTYTRPVLESRRPFSTGKIRAALTAPDSAAFQINLEILARIAGQLRRGGSAKLVIVECPFADEVAPVLQTSAWCLERDEFTRRREAWAAEHGVPWIDVTSELGLQQSDFLDPLHVDNPQVRRRFVEAVARRLAAFSP